MYVNALSKLINGIAIKIHNTVGPGCFEKVYEEILYYELVKDCIRVERQLHLPIKYESLIIKDAYVIDLLVENKLVVEIKSVYPLPLVYFKQVRTQLSLLNLKNGLLLNFKEEKMKDGMHRVFNNYGKESLTQTELDILLK